jgi:hypothetical protein
MPERTSAHTRIDTNRMRPRASSGIDAACLRDVTTRSEPHEPCRRRRRVALVLLEEVDRSAVVLVDAERDGRHLGDSEVEKRP